MSLFDKRIPELAPKGLLPSNGLFAWYDPATDTTYRISASEMLGAVLADPGSAWNEAGIYAQGDLVTYNGEVWISDVDDNQGNPPGPASLVWTLEPDEIPSVAEEGYIDLDTSGNVVIDMASKRDRRFKATANIAGAKNWSIINAGNAIEIPSLILVTTVAAPVQTFGAGFKMGNSNDWDPGAKTWAPLEAGEYDLRFTLQGGIWRITPSGPFY